MLVSCLSASARQFSTITCDAFIALRTCRKLYTVCTKCYCTESPVTCGLRYAIRRPVIEMRGRYDEWTMVKASVRQPDICYISACCNKQALQCTLYNSAEYNSNSTAATRSIHTTIHSSCVTPFIDSIRNKLRVPKLFIINFFVPFTSTQNFAL